MKITIDTKDNGAVVTFLEGESEVENRVFKFHPADTSDYVDMLYEVTEAIGMVGGKRAAHRVKIGVVHGEHFECDGCDICKEDRVSYLETALDFIAGLSFQPTGVRNLIKAVLHGSVKKEFFKQEMEIEGIKENPQADQV